MSPGRLGAVLAEKAQRQGAVFIRDDIQGLVKSADGWTVRGREAGYESDTVIVALGAWSRDILAPLGLHLPLMAERGYHIEFADPGIAIENSVLDVDAKFVASSMEGGARFAGQAEFALIDAPPDPKKKGLLARLAKAAFPDLRTDDAAFWMGRRPSFPDSLPALGKVPGMDGLLLNFRHSHYGLMMAPKSGQIVADVVQGNVPNFDMAPYAVGRFR